jgi:hypothetical protein
VLGDVTDDGSDTELLRIAAAVRGRGVQAMTVPGPADLAEGRRDRVQARFGAARWWFVHRQCVFVGLPGGPDDGAFLGRRPPPSAPPPRATVVFTTDVALPPLGVDLVVPPLPGVRLGRVDAAGKVTLEPLDVPSGSTLRTLARNVAVGLIPLVRSTVGYAAVLALAALLLAAAVVLLRRGR